MGPFGNTSVTYDTNGMGGPLFDAALLLPGQPPSLDTRTHFIAIESAWYFFQVNETCPFDLQLDFPQGIMGAGLAGTLSGRGDTEWVLDYFDQHPHVAREFSYQLCPVNAGRLWMGAFDGNETFGCSPVVGSKRWTVQACGMAITSHVNKSTTALSGMDNFGVCGSAGELDRCALLDSGEPDIMLPDPIHQRFVSALRSDPAYIAAFGTANDPFDPTYPVFSAPCTASKLTMDELRRQLPSLHIQLRNSSSHADNGTCTANHTFLLPGVDGYLSRFIAPSGSDPLYCATVQTTLYNPISASQFTVLGDSFM